MFPKVVFLSSILLVVSNLGPASANPSAPRNLGPLTEEDKRVVIIEDGEDHVQKLEPGPDYRLPGSLIPHHYFLQIRPLIYGLPEGVPAPAPGFVSITVTCVNTTDSIVLHEKFLEIDENSIKVQHLGNGTMLAVKNISYDEPRNFLNINTIPELVINGRYEISINFTAAVPANDSLRGLYYERYYDPIAEDYRIVAVTQLEPLRARQVFPCFDEPTYKSTFDVIIGRKEDFIALANSPLIKTEPYIEDWVWDTFATTVKMPTYLFAMGISQYSYSEAHEELYRLPVRVYGPSQLVKEGKAELTANASAKLMQHFETKYDINHNMPKVDSISVPYKRGAMENYGLITYGEYYLMHYEGVTTATELRGIYHILAHELGHQWFGNLVTCKWWSDIWLNEGFATYVSFEGVQALWPEFDMMTQMLHMTVNNALRYDAGPSSHPIHQEAYDAVQIGTNMDTIGYDKGASIIRMMVSFMGEEIFYSGIKRYLLKHYDDVAEQDDLFVVLDTASNEAGLELPLTVTEIMHSWTLQRGFPLVHVTLSGENVLTMRQDVWQNADARNGTEQPLVTWSIPIKWQYMLENGTSNSGDVVWLQQLGPPELSLSLEKGTSWLVVNPDAGGYYRTQYDNELLDRLLQQLDLNHTSIPTPGRVRLVDDQLTLGFQKYIPIESGLQFTKYLSNEKHPTVWSVVLANLQKLRDLYVPSVFEEAYTAFKNYLKPRLDSGLSSLMIPIKAGRPSSPIRSAIVIMETELIDWSCALNLRFCERYTALSYQLWKQENETIPIQAEHQSTLFCKIVEYFEKDGFEFILEQYKKNTTIAQLKRRLGPALGCTVDETTLESLITLTLKYEAIEKTDAIPILQKIMKHSVRGRNELMNLLRYSSATIISDFGWDVNALVQVLSVASLHLFSNDDVAMLEVIQLENADIYKDSLNSTIAAAKNNNKWVAEFGDTITTWFLQNS